jgi:hypothetical protein
MHRPLRVVAVRAPVPRSGPGLRGSRSQGPARSSLQPRADPPTTLNAPPAGHRHDHGPCCAARSNLTPFAGQEAPGRIGAGECLGAITGAGERLGPDHIGVPQAGRQDLLPGALPPAPVPVDTDLLHCSHLPGQPPVGAGGGQPGPGGPALGGTVRIRAAAGRHPKGACRVEHRGAAVGHPKVLPARLGGVRGSGPGRVRARRPRSGWRRRACPGGG